jgi:predicted nucleic acid-binding protein
VDRVFLDANVLFSAAWRPGAGLLRLWALPEVTLLSSGYAVEEARRNLALHRPARLEALEELLASVEIVSQPAPSFDLPEAGMLPAKDRPILEAAALARATHLLTGDMRDFGPLMGRRVAGILVLLPRDYLV